jgi:hypothetical protein
MVEKGEAQLLDLCASLASSSVDFSVSPASLACPIIILVRSLDLPSALSSSSSGRSTSLWLHCHLRQLCRRVRQVAIPPFGSVIAFVRSPDLPTAPSLPSPAQKTSPRFYAENEGISVGCVPNWPCQVLPGAWVLLL